MNKNELPSSKLQDIKPMFGTFTRGKPLGIEPENVLNIKTSKRGQMNYEISYSKG